MVMRQGWNSTCYQLLNEGIEHWWSSDESALVGFVRSGDMAVVAGAPVCAPDDVAKAVVEWEDYALQERLTVCYFGAEGRLQNHLALRPGYAIVSLGSQPEWHPSAFVDTCQAQSLRAQLHRAQNKGVKVIEWPREAAERSPELDRVLSQWLKSRGLPTLHFLVEPKTLTDIRDRRLFVAERQGIPVGFVTLCPVPARQGWLTEQFVRGDDAPNGTVELMLSEAARAVARESCTYFSMGIVPLVDSASTRFTKEPLWLNLLKSWARAHYTRFYNFRGLSEFKAKFRPERQEPVVVAVKADRFRVRHLRAIGLAFTQEPPELALLKGIVKAAKTELGVARHVRSDAPST